MIKENYKNNFYVYFLFLYVNLIVGYYYILNRFGVLLTYDFFSIEFKK